MASLQEWMRTAVFEEYLKTYPKLSVIFSADPTDLTGATVVGIIPTHISDTCKHLQFKNILDDTITSLSNTHYLGTNIEGSLKFYYSGTLAGGASGPTPPPAPPAPISDLVPCTYSKTYVNPQQVVQQDSKGISQLVDRCKTDDPPNYINNDTDATCIINSNSSGYDYDIWNAGNICIYWQCMVYEDLSCILSTQQCKTLVSSWLDKQSKKYSYKGTEVFLGIGHGVLKGVRGQCAILEYNNKYAIILQVDIRAWSLEITQAAWKYLLPDNVKPGGNCFIPNVKSVDCNEVLNTITPI
jgi:hypothetical protein